jgi:hypothetical protein
MITLAFAFTMLSVAAATDTPAQSSLVLLERTVVQAQGAWVVDYRLRHTGQTSMTITPEAFGVKVEGWVSNSRVASHAVPRWSSLMIPSTRELVATSEVNAAVDESQRCHEQLMVSVWAEGKGQPTPGLGTRPRIASKSNTAGAPPSTESTGLLPFSLSPAAMIRIRLRLEHQHVLYGDYDPLLAVRSVELRICSSTFRDILPLDREQYLAQPEFTWPEPPEDRRDTRHAISGPDSLHLEADIPGHQYYRYPERPVRYSTKMRLRFWYLIAAGTEGECRVRLAQSRETPTSWRPLRAGDFEQCLRTIGSWTKVERIIQTEPEATALGLEFKIVGETEVGEMWIDDVHLDPVSCTTSSGP